MRALLQGLILLLATGCAGLERWWSIVTTRPSPDQLSPGEQVLDGGVRVISHPGDFLGWGQLAVGLATIAAGVFGVKKVRKHRAAKRAAAAATPRAGTP